VDCPHTAQHSANYHRHKLGSEAWSKSQVSVKVMELELELALGSVPAMALAPAPEVSQCTVKRPSQHQAKVAQVLR